MTGLLRTLHSDERGSTVLEYTLVLPLMLALAIGIMEIAWVAWAKATLDYATAEAARCGTVRQDICGTDAEIQSYGASLAAGLKIGPADFTVTQTSCGLNVSAHAAAGFVTYVLPKNLPKLTAQACRS